MTARPWAARCLAALAVLAGCHGTGPGESIEAYVSETEAWQADREQRLRAEDGWLTLVGLHWLEAGMSSFGSGSDNTIVLPVGAAPDRAGVLVVEGEAVRLIGHPGAGLTLGGRGVTEEVLDPVKQESEEIRVGRLRMLVLRRGERFALRVKDPASPVRRDFPGIETYPVDPAWRVRAELHAYDEPRPIDVPTVLGVPVRQWVPGVLELTIDGAPRQLLPLVDEPGQTSLFLIFKDRTSGIETYGAGRYLYADLDHGKAIVDFNKAYNPPCAFTPYATCPLPPPENHMDVAVTAGEKAPPGHDRKRADLESAGVP
jgi:uncharacterized protein (DUF1684 family)